MKLRTVHYVSLIGLFLFSTGVIVPWIINSNDLPIGFIIAGMVCVVLMWIALLENIIKRLMRKYKRYVKRIR